MKYIKAINERLSSILYHFTYLSSLEEILESNSIILSSTVSTKSDNHIQAYKNEEPYGKGLSFKYPYFTSFSRTKDLDLGFQRTKPKRGLVRMCFNGDLLNRKYVGTPVDYWQRKDMTMINNSHLSDNDKYHRILADFEHEDRLLSKDDRINNVSKYINHIDIIVENYHDNKNVNIHNVLYNVLKKAMELEIDIFIYDNKKDFDKHTKNTINSIILEKGLTEVSDEDKPYESRYYLNDRFLIKVLAIIGYKNDPSDLTDYIKEFSNKLISKYNIKFELTESVICSILDYMRGLSYGNRDFISSLQSDVKNTTNSPKNGENQKVLKMLVDYLVKNKMKSIEELLNYKVEGRINPTNKKYSNKKCFARIPYYKEDGLEKIPNDTIIGDCRNFYFGRPYGISRKDADYFFDNFYTNKTIGEFIDYIFNNFTPERANEIVKIMSSDNIVITDI